MSNYSAFLASKIKRLGSSVWDSFIRQLQSDITDLQEKATVQEQAANAIVARGLNIIESDLEPIITTANNDATTLIANLTAEAGALITDITTTKNNANTVKGQIDTLLTQATADVAVIESLGTIEGGTFP